MSNDVCKKTTGCRNLPLAASFAAADTHLCELAVAAVLTPGGVDAGRLQLALHQRYERQHLQCRHDCMSPAESLLQLTSLHAVQPIQATP